MPTFYALVTQSALVYWFHYYFFSVLILCGRLRWLYITVQAHAGKQY